MELFPATVHPGNVVTVHPGDIIGGAMPETFPQGRAQARLFGKPEYVEEAGMGHCEGGDKSVKIGGKGTVADENEFQRKDILRKHAGYAFPKELGLFPAINGHEYGIGIGWHTGLTIGHRRFLRKLQNPSPPHAGEPQSANRPLSSRPADTACLGFSKVFCMKHNWVLTFATGEETGEEQ
jgi:hypothetical protein